MAAVVVMLSVETLVVMLICITKEAFRMVGESGTARGAPRHIRRAEVSDGAAQVMSTSGGARSGRPYSAREAAALLGVSHDTLTRHYESVHGYRLGARVLFPRWAVDRLVADPSAEPVGAETAAGEAPAVERVLALLSLLSVDDLRKVTRAILAREVV